MTGHARPERKVQSSPQTYHPRIGFEGKTLRYFYASVQTNTEPWS